MARREGCISQGRPSQTAHALRTEVSRGGPKNNQIHFGNSIPHGGTDADSSLLRSVFG
jgi:hypothetical protein